jgi:Cystatin domain
MNIHSSRRRLVWSLACALLFPFLPLRAEGVPGGYSAGKVTDDGVVEAAKAAAEAQAGVMGKETARPVKIKVKRILSVHRQVVAGLNYRLKMEVDVDGKVRPATAVVWATLQGKHELTSWQWDDAPAK